MRWIACLLGLALWPAAAAELRFDLAEIPEGKLPPGFQSALTGQGRPPEWRVQLEDVPPALAPLTPQAPAVTRRPVIAQVSRDPTDDRYPLLVYEPEVFRDFKLTARFKIIGGAAEQMAGLAFRIQDTNNYYYVRASALGKTFYFFKFVNGQLIGPIGSRIELTPGSWHEMAVECRGSQITCYLDGQAIIPHMQQDTFAKGRIGLWTKSDSVSCFTDIHVEYEPLDPPAQKLVQDTLKKYNRLLDVRIYTSSEAAGATRLVGGRNPAQLGQPGSENELDVLRRGVKYYGKDKESVSVVLPVRDRNGEVIAAARIVMRTFRGQTESNAFARATPILQFIQSRVGSAEDLVE